MEGGEIINLEEKLKQIYKNIDDCKDILNDKRHIESDYYSNVNGKLDNMSFEVRSIFRLLEK